MVSNEERHSNLQLRIAGQCSGKIFLLTSFFLSFFWSISENRGTEFLVKRDGSISFDIDLHPVKGVMGLFATRAPGFGVRNRIKESLRPRVCAAIEEKNIPFFPSSSLSSELATAWPQFREKKPVKINLMCRYIQWFEIRCDKHTVLMISAHELVFLGRVCVFCMLATLEVSPYTYGICKLLANIWTDMLSANRSTLKGTGHCW